MYHRLAILSSMFLLHTAPIEAQTVLDVASTFPNSMTILGDVSQELPEKLRRFTKGEL